MVTGDSPASAATRPLPLRARSDLQAERVEYRGRGAWTVRDPLSLRCYQLRDEEYFVLTMLDGSASLASLLAAFRRKFAPRRLRADQLQAFLATLHREGLILADTPGQGEPLWERRRAARRRRWGLAWLNVLAIRFPGVNPAPVLDWLHQRLRWVYSRGFLVAYLLLVLSAVGLAATRFSQLQARLPDFHAFFSPRNLVLIAAAVALSKVLHELAHGLTCKHFGGECHELGLMLLVFTPCLYCNVSGAWLIPSKWQRMAIGGAGVAVEVFVAALCAWLWYASEPGLFNTLCLNLMFAGAVSTLLINGNPLLRFDGYYVLADWLEIPNLHQQASLATRLWLGRFFLGSTAPGENAWLDDRRSFLLAYGLGAAVYRWVVIVGILWFCYVLLRPYGLSSLAVLLAVVVVGGMIAPAVAAAVAFLGNPARHRGISMRRLLLRSSLAVGALGLAMAIPLPRRVVAPALVQPREARRVYVSAPGVLTQGVRVGDVVGQGQVLAELKNLDLERDIAGLAAQMRLQRLQVELLRKQRIADPALADQLPAAEQAQRDIEERLQKRHEEWQRLTITAPIAGQVLPPPSRGGAGSHELSFWEGTPLEAENLGCYLDVGTLVCLVGDPQQLEALAVVEQGDVGYVRPQQPARVFLSETPGRSVVGEVVEVSRLDLDSAPPEMLAAGRLPTQRDARGAARLAGAFYVARIRLPPDGPPLLAGAAGEARIQVASQSLGARVYRSLRRTFRWAG